MFLGNLSTEQISSGLQRGLGLVLWLLSTALIVVIVVEILSADLESFSLTHLESLRIANVIFGGLVMGFLIAVNWLALRMMMHRRHKHAMPPGCLRISSLLFIPITFGLLYAWRSNPIGYTRWIVTSLIATILLWRLAQVRARKSR